MAASADHPLCADCQTRAGQVEIRRRQLCQQCFYRYVYSKVLKRMEPYRFTNLQEDQERRLLLPLSGGPCSLTLLHLLDAQLKDQQEARGRTAYELTLVHVDLPDLNDSEEARKLQDSVSKLFPKYKYLPFLELHNIFELDVEVEHDLLDLNVRRLDGEDDQDFMRRLLSCASTPTARQDLQDVLMTRLLIAAAKSNGCKGILWGHSDSHLAAKALADVAKGRGGSVPVTIADGASSFGIKFNYPMRDLYRKEIDLHIEFSSQQLTGCYMPESTDKPEPLSVRNTSIDALLANYIVSQGEKYPSIVANVVRTTSKLQAQKNSNLQICKLCAKPVDGTTNTLCYGCLRLKQDIKV